MYSKRLAAQEAIAQLGLDRLDQALSRGVIPAVSATAHAGLESDDLEGLAVGPAGVLHASIRVVDQSLGRSPGLHGPS
jgi:hypothetical protein